MFAALLQNRHKQTLTVISSFRSYSWTPRWIVTVWRCLKLQKGTGNSFLDCTENNAHCKESVWSLSFRSTHCGSWEGDTSFSHKEAACLLSHLLFSRPSIIRQTCARLTSLSLCLYSMRAVADGGNFFWHPVWTCGGFSLPFGRGVSVWTWLKFHRICAVIVLVWGWIGLGLQVKWVVVSPRISLFPPIGLAIWNRSPRARHGSAHFTQQCVAAHGKEENKGCLSEPSTLKSGPATKIR